MSVFKRIVNLGRGAVSASLKDDAPADPSFERELLEAARQHRETQPRAAHQRTSAQPSEAAREDDGALGAAPEAQAPELDELGMPQPQKRTL